MTRRRFTEEPIVQLLQAAEQGEQTVEALVRYSTGIADAGELTTDPEQCRREGEVEACLT